MQRQIIHYLVEGDNAPNLSVRFSGLNLADYSAITMRVALETTNRRFARPVEPDPTDPELGVVEWHDNDLVEGNHRAEFEFEAASGVIFTLPQKYPVILAVRRDL